MTWPSWWNAEWDKWFRSQRGWVTPRVHPPAPTTEMLILAASPARGPLGAAAVTAALTGTVTTANQADIVAGGKTIILTLTNDTWVASGATFNAQRQNIINGLTSAQSETHGWNNEVKAKIAVTDVVRTSNTVVTITLDAESAYVITANETITATIPGTACVGGGQVVAVPTFQVLSAVSDEPTYTGAAGQTLVFSGNSSNLLSGLTAAGAADGGSSTRFVPFPSPYIDGNPVVSSVCGIQTTGGKTGGVAVRNMWPTGGGQLGGDWVVVNGGTIAASKSLIVTRYFKITGTSIGSSEFAVKWRRNPLQNAGGQGGGAPQWSTHNHLPWTGTVSGVGTFWQCYDQGYTDDAGQNQATQPLAPYFKDLYDGAWHRETTLYRSHSAAGVYDGRMAMWIDGTKVMDMCTANIDVTPAGGTKAWCTVAQVQNMNVNNPPDPTETVWIGGTRTADPGVDVTSDTDVPSCVVWYQ